MFEEKGRVHPAKTSAPQEAAGNLRREDPVVPQAGEAAPLSEEDGVVCAKCKVVNPLTEEACTRCGSRLWIVCPSCGLRNPRRHSRCVQCDTNLHPKATRRSKGEARRQADRFWKRFGRLIIALFLVGLAVAAIISYLVRSPADYGQ